MTKFYEECVSCDNSDTSKVNEKQQIMCDKHSTYVDMFNSCDDFSGEETEEFFAEIDRQIKEEVERLAKE